MNLKQALYVNVGTVTSMISENLQVRGPHEGERSEAKTRGGLISSSCEGSVMELEPRGQPGTGNPASTEEGRMREESILEEPYDGRLSRTVP